MSLYDAILKKTILLKRDGEYLMKKRGFTEDTIRYFNFKSPLSQEKAMKIVSDIGKKVLQRERLLQGETLIPSLTRNGLIPFYEKDKNGNRKCVQIKGHKYGLPGKTPRLFRATRDDVSTLYLCESEYKAAAMWQLGYSAIGLCGISTFIGKHFNTLLETLCDIRPEKCVVLFDNDDKASPESDKFSSDPSGRYDAFKYQWFISHTLEQKGIKSFVANLPDSWRIRGACDVDGSLANGKTKEEFESAIGESTWLTPNEFKESWIGTGEMDDVLTPWADAKEKVTQIKIKNNCMWSTDKKGDSLKLTNFDMLVTTIHTDENDNILSRYVTVINEFGKKYHEVEIENTDLSSAGKFSTWCLGHPGNIIYSGEPRNMHEIGTYLNIVSTPTVVKHTNVMGWNTDHNAFLFDEGAYQGGIRYDAENGRMFLPSGPVEIDSLFGEDEGPFKMSINTDVFDWRDAIERIVNNYGDGQIRLVIAWLAASSMADIFEKYTNPKLFPLLWVTGAMGSGKNTLLQQSMSFIGIHGFEGIAVNQITEASLWKLLSHFGSLPVWIDELRNDKYCERLNGVWRSVYNRTCTSKSKLNTDNNVITNKVRGVVALTGQDISGDTALNQRFIPIRINKNNRTGLTYEWINENSSKFSYMIHEILSRRDEIEAYIKDNILEEKNKWKKISNDDRLSSNIAIVTVMAKAIGIDIYKKFRMKEWVYNMTSDIMDASDDAEFLDGISEIINAEPILTTQLFSIESKTGNIFMAYGYAYSLWKAYMNRKGQSCMGQKAIEDELVSHGICIEVKARKYVLNSDGKRVQTRGIVLDYKMVSEELMSSIQSEMDFRSKIENGKFVI